MAQRIDNKADPEQLQGAPNPDMNPTVELHRTKEDAIKEFLWKHGTITIDWYVPDFCNTRVGDLIKEKHPLETTEGRILFRCPTLGKFFETSIFELDLRTGRVFTYLDPPENIGIKCQKEPFDPEFLRNTEVKRIPVQCKKKNSRNSKCKEISQTSRHHGLRGSRIQNMLILPTLDNVCR